MVQLLNRREFQDASSRTAEFEGKGFGANVSFFLVDNDRGQGPNLHQHDYPETWIVQRGNAQFTVSSDVIDAAGGDIIVVPPRTPHKFINNGAGRLEMVCIHASDHIVNLPPRLRG